VARRDRTFGPGQIFIFVGLAIPVPLTPAVTRPFMLALVIGPQPLGAGDELRCPHCRKWGNWELVDCDTVQRESSCGIE
jgi:hypothetical protein